jgi:NAD(P)-dependent dehydrogenase (short-subunit alcohol dehydrogenase family)
VAGSARSLVMRYPTSTVLLPFFVTVRRARRPGPVRTVEVAGIAVHVVGMIGVTQGALPLLRKSANPVVVNITSVLGSLRAVSAPGSPLAHVPAIVYGASKAAASMLTLQYANAIPEVKFNGVDPGATATDMTVGRGGRPVEQSAEVIVRLATIGPNGPTGTFQVGAGEQPW